MYVPEPYRETREDVLVGTIEEASFGTLITTGPAGIATSHVPFAVASRAPLRLVTHLARPNPQARMEPGEAVAAFVLDSAYVHPGWYPSKAEGGRVVPTWNYVAVEARGPARLVEDQGQLHAILEAVTRRHEAGRAEPWSITDAPEDYVTKLSRGIVGVEIDVTALTGAWKLGQTKDDADHAGTVRGLTEAGAGRIAALMEAARRR